MANYMWGDNETQFFFQLTPEIVLKALDDLGLNTTGRCLTLNSMENRVYDVELDSGEFVVAKFYRPGRWTKQQILEEHEFLLDLQEAEVPAIAPLKFANETLFELDSVKLFYCVFPRRGGRMPQEMHEEQLQITGRYLARMHNIGANKKAQHRITISPATYGEMNLKFLMDNKIVPTQFQESYQSTARNFLELITPMFKNIPIHRIHGDCHWGNMIWREPEGLYFIDFDDMLIGPAVQDIWLVVPGRDPQDIENRNILLEAYEEFRQFDFSQIKLIEPLRGLRYMHFSAWIAKRWQDQSFQNAFPQFAHDQYWHTQIMDLHEQIRIIQELQTPQYY